MAKEGEDAMEVMFDRVAGLDVGKETVTVCLRAGPAGGGGGRGGEHKQKKGRGGGGGGGGARNRGGGRGGGGRGGGIGSRRCATRRCGIEWR